jgi:hypothetical protein
VPFVKHFEEVYEVHGYFFNLVLGKLPLVNFKVALMAGLCHLLLQQLPKAAFSEEARLVADLFRDQLEDIGPHLGHKLCCLLTFMLLAVLEECCGSVEGANDHRTLGVPLEFNVLNAHLYQHHTHVSQEVHLLRLAQVALEFVGVGLMEVVVSHKVYLEIKCTEKLLLLHEDIFSWDGLVSDLLRDHLGVKREDVFVFRR